MAGFEVVIPKSDQPKFPPICIGCGGEPTTTFKIKADASGWWAWIQYVGALISILGGRAYDVPVCEPCRARLTRQRRLRAIGKGFFTALGIVLALWLVEDEGGIEGKLAVFGVLLVALLPWWAFERFYPPTVDLTVTSSSVTFQFADQAYADKFAGENT